jgi:hypothetical protein
MYISDRDALKYSTGLLLIFIPFIFSFFNIWSWFTEIFLFISVFIVSRNIKPQIAALLLALGYLGAIIGAGAGGIWQIGFSPWAGILFVVLENKGLGLRYSMFWSLMFVVLLSGLTLIPGVKEALYPDRIQETVAEVFQTAKELGFIANLEQQGVPSQYFERHLEIVVPTLIKLKPAAAGILGMAEMGSAYLIAQLFEKTKIPLTPFSKWQLPWYGVWVAIFGIGGYLGGDYLGLEVLKIIGMNLIAVSAALSLVLGASCLVYFLSHPKTPRYLIFVFILGLIFFFHFIILVLF